MIDKMHFLEEEIIVTKEKVNKESDPFTTNSVSNEKDSYAKFKVVKVGEKQTKVKKGDLVLINQNGLNKEITIEGFGVIENHYSLQTSNRIYCILEDE